MQSTIGTVFDDGSTYVEMAVVLTFQLEFMLMTTIQSVQELLPDLTRSEKALLLQWIAADLGDTFPGIESRPDICGGEPCIVRTRIPVWLLVQARRLGTAEAELLRAYPSLNAQDLVNAWAYYRSHREEIDLEISEAKETSHAHEGSIASR